MEHFSDFLAKKLICAPFAQTLQLFNDCLKLIVVIRNHRCYIHLLLYLQCPNHMKPVLLKLNAPSSYMNRYDTLQENHKITSLWRVYPQRGSLSVVTCTSKHPECVNFSALASSLLHLFLPGYTRNGHLLWLLHFRPMQKLINTKQLLDLQVTCMEILKSFHQWFWSYGKCMLMCHQDTLVL